MKRLAAIVMAAVLFLTALPALAAELADGVYEGAARGMNGDVTLRVAVYEGNILMITPEHSESPEVGSPAVDQLIQRALEAQGPDVDAVAGATETSEAFIAALESALAKAGWEPDPLPTIEIIQRRTPVPVAAVSAPEIAFENVLAVEDGVSRISGDIVVMSWHSEGEVQSYRMAITDEGGAEIKCLDISDTQYYMPADALTPGEVYALSVTAVPLNGALETDGVESSARFALYVEPAAAPETALRRGEATTVSAGAAHTVGLRADGTVAAIGNDISSQCNTGKWQDIVAVSAGNGHTVGLRADGTVVAAGRNDYGQYDTGDWQDIVALSAGGNHTVGLKADGTVVAVGKSDDGACDTGDWQDIVAISAGEAHTVGLRADGTVVAVGRNDCGQCDTGDWQDIVAVSAGGNHTVGLKADGTVVAVGLNGDHQCEIGDWQDIIAVSAGGYHTVGLRADGTVAAVGGNSNGQCDTGDWRDIVAVSANYQHTVGLRADGTVVAVGRNKYGQCDTGDWRDIRLP